MRCHVHDITYDLEGRDYQHRRLGPPFPRGNRMLSIPVGMNAKASRYNDPPETLRGMVSDNVRADSSHKASPVVHAHVDNWL